MNKILIIDDDVKLTELLSEFLATFNYDTKVFHNPIKGIEYLDKDKIDLIILDIMLPEIDGFQVGRFFFSKKNTFEDGYLRKVLKGGVQHVFLTPFRHVCSDSLQTSFLGFLRHNLTC